MSKWEEAANDKTESKFQATAREWSSHADYYKEGFIAGAEYAEAKALKEAAQVCTQQREAYHEDIFPDYDWSAIIEVSADRVAGKMGRFLCDVLAREILALKEREME